MELAPIRINASSMAGSGGRINARIAQTKQKSVGGTLPRYNIEPAPMGIYKFHGGDGRPYKLPKVGAAIVDLNKVQAVRPPRSAMETPPIRIDASSMAGTGGRIRKRPKIDFKASQELVTSCGDNVNLE